MRYSSHWQSPVVLAALLLLCASSASTPAHAADTPPQFVRAWGTLGTGPGEFTYPQGIELAPNGSVYVVDTGNHRIQVFSALGEFLFQWGSQGSGPGQFNFPAAIAFNSAGEAYVTDFANFRVQKFTGDGQFLLSFGEAGTGDGQFRKAMSSGSGPYGIAVDALGDVYVGDTAGWRVQKFSGTGQFLTKWGSYGSGAGQFSQLSGIAVDPTGNVYVTDQENNNTQEFTSYGIFVRSFVNGTYDRPVDVAVLSAGELAVLGGAGCGVAQFALGGGFLTAWGACGDSLGQFYGPFGISVDPKGNYYVADTYAHRIEVFHDDSVPVRATSWGAIKAIYR